LLVAAKGYRIIIPTQLPNARMTGSTKIRATIRPNFRSRFFFRK